MREAYRVWSPWQQTSLACVEWGEDHQSFRLVYDKEEVFEREDAASLNKFLLRNFIKANNMALSEYIEKGLEFSKESDKKEDKCMLNALYHAQVPPGLGPAPSISWFTLRL